MNKDDWAKEIIQELQRTPEDKKVHVISEHLIKAFKMGYLDGVDNGWWKQQEGISDEISLGE